MSRGKETVIIEITEDSQREMQVTQMNDFIRARSDTQKTARMDEIKTAADALENGQPLDLAAIDLHAALDCLGEVTGDRVDEKLLDSVFSRFCVGK